MKVVTNDATEDEQQRQKLKCASGQRRFAHDQFCSAAQPSPFSRPTVAIKATFLVSRRSTSKLRQPR